MKSAFIFLSGQITKVGELMLQCLWPGVVKGRGVFETMRVYDGKPFALKLHFSRLHRGLKLLRLKNPYSFSKWEELIQEILGLNHLTQGRLRLMIWENEGILRTSIVAQKISVQPKSWKAVISNIRQNKTKTSNIKSINYQHFYQAYQSAMKKGYDEAILLNRFDNLVEGSRSNLFFIKDQILYMPSISCGCLEGITRKIVLTLAKENKISAREVKATYKDLLNADEAFMTNSLVEIMPLVGVNLKSIGTGKIGPVTRILQKAYANYRNNSQ